MPKSNFGDALHSQRSAKSDGADEGYKRFLLPRMMSVYQILVLLR